MEQELRAGGQAVIEGVMMRCGKRMAVAVRSADGSISVREERLLPLGDRYRALRLPIIRGAVSLVESLSLGIRALMYSANAQAETTEEELSPREMIGAVAFAVVLAVALFILLPTLLSSVAGLWVGGGLALNLIEGLIRLTVVVGYIAVVGLLPDMERVLEYHGAEHKVIRAWESGSPADIAAARSQSTEHVRCGTSFILMVALVSIAVFSLFGWPSIWGRIGMRLLLLPLVAGLAYELILAAARRSNPVVGALMRPGLWMQKLTTREPDDGQLEVAMTALQRCIRCGQEDCQIDREI